MHINLLKHDNLPSYLHGMKDGRAIDKEHNDGGGLYLVVKPSGARSWMFKFTWAGKAKKMGLGSLQLVTLDQARQLAHEARQKVVAGVNPLVERPGKAVHQTSPLFLEYATKVMAVKSHGQAPKSVQQWERCVNIYAKPLHKMEIANITRQHIVECLEPMWLAIPVSASAFRTKLEMIFKHAQANNVYPETARNPAAWDLLSQLLKRQPPAGTSRGSNKALEYVDMPAFWADLVARNTTSSKTLQLTILTCVRTKEAMQASWEQLDLDAARWKIPGKVMKNGKQADVPLSSDAIALLREVKALHEQLGWSTEKGLVFRGKDNRSVQSANTLLKLIKEDLGRDVTTHGFRSTFRTWTQNTTSYDNDTLEYCLHHITGDASELAYKRGDMWEKRQAALQDWANFVVDRKKRGRPALTVVAA